ncbi:MAG TPA: hypothetical protein VNQ76_04175 [Planctomicrobium sp.]|nr:hypothetical protein [Planctomicrobium sp.]
MARRPRSSGSLLATVSVVLAVVFLGGTATYGTLFAMGYLQPAGKPSRAGLFPLPKAVRPIKAFTQIRREDVYDLKLGDDSYFWLPKQQVEAHPEWFRTVDDVVGRVMARDKEKDYLFSEKDFLPNGTRPGIAGGIPAGKRAMVVAADKIEGLTSLKRGDRFDLYASQTAKTESGRTPLATDFSESDSLTGGLKSPGATALELQKRLGIRLLVRDGALVEITQVPPTGRGGPKQNVTLAVAPEEVISLTHALGGNYSVFCAFRSGQPETTGSASEQRDPLTLGMIPYPVRTVRIPAYTQITPDLLRDAETGQTSVFYFEPGNVEPGWIANPRELIGRVTARNLHSGYLFEESDLLPKGTPAGIAGAVPKGKVAMTVPGNRIQGLDHLFPGDRFVIVSELPQTAPLPAPQIEWATLRGGIPDPVDEQRSQELRTGVKRLANDAIKLSGNDEAAVIAVDAPQLVSLTQAIGSDVPLRAAVLSRQDVTEGKESGRRPDSDKALHPYPVLTRPVAAQTRLRIEDFIDPATGKPRLYYFKGETIEENWMADLESLIGRVTSRAIDPGFVIRKEDLLPEGTRPGLTAGIEPGSVGVTVTSEQVDGLSEFQSGDRVMLVVARSYRQFRKSDETFGISGTVDDFADTTVLADDALLLSTEVREVIRPIERRTDTEKGIVYDVQLLNLKLNVAVLSLAPEAVTKVNEAIATRARIFAVARSANADDDPRPPLLAEVRAGKIEHIRGLKDRRVHYYRPEQREE